MTTDHINTATLALYVSGYQHFSAQEKDRIRSHLRECGICTRRLEKHIGIGARKGRAEVLQRLLDKIFLTGFGETDPEETNQAVVGVLGKEHGSEGPQASDLPRVARWINLTKFAIGCATLMCICYGLFATLPRIADDMGGKGTTVSMRGFEFVVPAVSFIIAGLFGAGFFRLRTLKKQRLDSLGRLYRKAQEILANKEAAAEELGKETQALRERTMQLEASNSRLTQECEELSRDNHELRGDSISLRHKCHTLPGRVEEKHNAVIRQFLERAIAPPQTAKEGTAPPPQGAGGAVGPEEDETLNALSHLYGLYLRGHLGLRGSQGPPQAPSFREDPSGAAIDSANSGSDGPDDWDTIGVNLDQDGGGAVRKLVENLHGAALIEHVQGTIWANLSGAIDKSLGAAGGELYRARTRVKEALTHLGQCPVLSNECAACRTYGLTNAELEDVRAASRYYVGRAAGDYDRATREGEGRVNPKHPSSPDAEPGHSRIEDGNPQSR